VTRVCCISDLHGRLPRDLPECDLLVIAGDILPASWHGAIELFLPRFEMWLRWAPARTVVGIAGNHDIPAQHNPALFRELPWIYLENDAASVEGLKVWGSPWTPRFFDWAFMADDGDLADHWVEIPDDVELLITHGPPFGYLDSTVEGVHAGSRTLLDRVLQLKQLKLHVFGHIHEAYGVATLPDGATIVNASLLNERYDATNHPSVIDL
jgi:predicted phosphodiesterase